MPFKYLCTLPALRNSECGVPVQDDATEPIILLDNRHWLPRLKSLMLPPIAPGVLDSNPLFAELYNHLTTHLIDPVDASTRASSRPNDVLDQVTPRILATRHVMLSSLPPSGTPHPPCRARKNQAPSARARGIDQPDPGPIGGGFYSHP